MDGRVLKQIFAIDHDQMNNLFPLNFHEIEKVTIHFPQTTNFFYHDDYISKGYYVSFHCPFRHFFLYFTDTNDKENNHFLSYLKCLT